MNAPIRIRDTVALLVAIVAGAVALAQGIAADVHVPAARMLAAECQGFEALATVGGTPMTCDAALAADNSDIAVVPAAGGVADAPIDALTPAPASRG